MAGRIDPPWIVAVLLVIGVGAIVTDLWRRKIYNWITFPAMFCGMAWMTWHSGLHGLGASLAGILVALGCFGLFMGLRWLGAGDVKLLMAFGAWGGARYSAEVALFSIILGGMLTLLVMVLTGRLLGFLKRFYHFARSFLIRELEIEPLKIDRRFRLPFAIPLVIAAISEALGNPLQHWQITIPGVWNG